MATHLLMAAGIYGIVIGEAQWRLASGEPTAGILELDLVMVALIGMLLAAERHRQISRRLCFSAAFGILAGAAAGLARGWLGSDPPALYLPWMVGYGAIGMYAGTILSSPREAAAHLDAASLSWSIMGALLASGAALQNAHQELWTVLAGAGGGILGTCYGPLANGLRPPLR